MPHAAGDTELSITVIEGTNRIVGQDSSRIMDAVREILAGNTKRGRVPRFWDGYAAERIVEVLLREISMVFKGGVPVHSDFCWAERIAGMRATCVEVLGGRVARVPPMTDGQSQASPACMRTGTQSLRHQQFPTIVGNHGKGHRSLNIVTLILLLLEYR